MQHTAACDLAGWGRWTQVAGHFKWLSLQGEPLNLSPGTDCTAHGNQLNGGSGAEYPTAKEHMAAIAATRGDMI